jgi:hypothetical protein
MVNLIDFSHMGVFDELVIYAGLVDLSEYFWCRGFGGYRM